MTDTSEQSHRLCYRDRQARLDDILRGFGTPSAYNPYLLAEDAETSSRRDFKVDYLLTRSWLKGVSDKVNELSINPKDFVHLSDVAHGQFGTISAVRCHFDRRVYALKSMRKVDALRSQNLSVAVERHLHLQARIDESDHASGLVAAFHTETALHFVLPFAIFGSLWDRMQDLRPFTHQPTDEWSQSRMAESEIRWWAGQMIASIEWLHNLNYVHRLCWDIKPHNYLIHEDYRLVLTDFGSAAPVVRGEEAGTAFVPYNLCQIPAGTPDYIAPEVLMAAEEATMEAVRQPDQGIAHSELGGDAEKVQTQGYTATVDCWSLGCVLYELAFELPPFFADSVDETYDMIKRFDGTIQIFPVGRSTSFCLLLESLIAKSAKRARIADLQRHEWLSQTKAAKPSDVPLQPLTPPHSIPDESAGYEFSHLLHSVDVVGPNTPASRDARNARRFLGFTYQPPAEVFAVEDAMSVQRDQRSTTSEVKQNHSSRSHRKASLTGRSRNAILHCVQQSVKRRLQAQADTQDLSSGVDFCIPSRQRDLGANMVNEQYGALASRFLSLEKTLAELQKLVAD